MRRLPPSHMTVRHSKRYVKKLYSTMHARDETLKLEHARRLRRTRFLPSATCHRVCHAPCACRIGKRFLRAMARVSAAGWPIDSRPSAAPDSLSCRTPGRPMAEGLGTRYLS